MPHTDREAGSVDRNATRCPSCGAPTRRTAARNQARRGRPRAGSVSDGEDVEIEVRDALYGRHSSSVERRPSG